MSTLSAYADRQVDLLGFHGAVVGRETRLLQSLVDHTGEAALTAGVQKLAQRFLLALLTPLGSMRYREELGSTFLIDASAGLWRSAPDVEASFSAASLGVRQQLQAEESDADPDDERFVDARILAVSWLLGDASISLQIESRAGETRDILLPLTVSPLQ